MITVIMLLFLTILLLCFFVVRLNRLRIKHKTEAAFEKASSQQHLSKLQELQVKLAEYEKHEASRISLEDNDRDYLKELLVREERTRIAQELHDDTVQRIIMARFRIINAMHNEEPSSVKDQVNLAVRELQLVVDDLRFLIDNEVKPVFETSDLVLSLKNLAKDYNQIWLGKRVSIEVINAQKQFLLTSEITSELYSIIHETITNAIKSSVATDIDMFVKWGNDLTIVVKDNGQSRIIAEPGRGTRNIKARVIRIGAEMQELNTPDGYKLTLTMQRPI